MSKSMSEALQLAAMLEWTDPAAAAELRRLHDENEELRAAIKGLQGGNESLARISAAGREKYVELMAENEALLAANRDCLLHFNTLKADYDKAVKALVSDAPAPVGLPAGESTAAVVGVSTSNATTHAFGCHTWGPKHYECAVRVNKELMQALQLLHDSGEDNYLFHYARSKASAALAKAKGTV